jgi:ATP-dependent DNA helicase DinG
MRKARHKVEEILGAGGLVAKVVAGYDPRPQQLEMGLAVLDALAHERVLLVEAPTGVGKTLAYLVPAALYARQHHEPVIISSYTRALQDQILQQETPRLRRLIHPDLAIVALKGRSNYLCRRRWELFLAEEASGPDGRRIVELLEEWVYGTETGDFAEAPDLGPRAGWVQRRIGGDPRFCRGRTCRPETGCFHKLARRAAKEADLVVVNHSLLIADAIGGGVLPEHRALVIDEAHLLPDAALDQLTVCVTERSLTERIRLIGGAGEPGASDRLRRAAHLLPSRVAARNAAGHVRALEDAAQQAIAAARAFCAALTRLPAFPAASERRRYGAGEPLEGFPPGEFDALLERVESLTRTARDLMSELTAAPQPESSEEIAGLLEAAQVLIDELEEELAALQQLLAPEPRQFVYCMGQDPREGASLTAIPLETGHAIRELILDRHASTVMASATLAVDARFDHFASLVGLEANEALTMSLPSPFPLAQQLLTLVPAYAVDPRRSGYAAFLAAAVRDLVPEVPHKALVLFTSYETLEQVAEDLGRGEKLGDAALLVQHREAVRTQLIDRFRALPRAVLLGTASFWYGVDFPGEELELLAMTRLPFPVPTDPRAEALNERAAESGRSGFELHALPEAILRFRQGLGRLIRRARDRGVCVVLDPRIMSAPYGGRFRAALPSAPVTVGDAAELRARVRGWFADADEGGGR